MTGIVVFRVAVALACLCIAAHSWLRRRNLGEALGFFGVALLTGSDPAVGVGQVVGVVGAVLVFGGLGLRVAQHTRTLR